MDHINGFTPEYHKELQHKIYGVCYDYLNLNSSEDRSPDILLGEEGYDLNELSAPDLIYKVGSAIGLPYEIIYLRFPYLDYFECDDPKPLTIQKFADTLIEILEIYQMQWQRFRFLAEYDQEKYYTKIYSVIEKYLPLHTAVFSPDMFINVGGYSVDGLMAQSMIERVAFVMGLNTKDICETFDNQQGFNLPIKWYHVPIYIIWGAIFFVIGLLCLILYLIFYSIKWLITKKWNFHLPPADKLTPMTVKEFADKIIGIRLVESYYNHRKGKGE